MNKMTCAALAAVLLFAWGCEPPAEMPDDSAGLVVEQPTQAADSETLPTPFTAEQIRDEWSAGLRLFIERNGEDGELLTERWTVTESNAVRATIEFAQLDASGNPVGEPAVAPSGWAELRDHASFAPGSATRERATRDSGLGTQEGWLYNVQESDGVVTEYFFADAFPGAPVEMISHKGDEVVGTFRQIKRERVEIQ